MTKRAALAPMLLAAIAYGNILGNRFTNWDDAHLIVRNTAIRSFDPVFVIRHFHITYPPLNVLSHAADYAFWRLNPVGYHLTDILLYLLIVFSFFLLCRAILGDERGALAAAALFAVHPLHVESVAWLSSRKDGLGMLLYFLAFLAHVRAARGGGRRFAWLGALFYMGALWSKPLMITLPVALALHDLLLLPRGVGRIRGIAGRLAPYAVPILLTALAAALLDPRNEMRTPYHGGSPYMTFLAVATVLGDYGRMLVLPTGLSPLYVVRIPSGIAEARVLVPLAVATLAVALAARYRPRAPLPLFCLLWAAAGLLPVLQIIPVNVVKADRYLYLPTAALCLLAGWAAAAVREGALRRAAAGALLAGVTAFTVLTIAQNTVWRDSAALWERVLMRDPSNADAYNNLGIARAEAGDLRGAEEVLAQALRLRPDFPSARNNLATVYRMTGRHDEALEELGRAAGLARDVVYAASAHVNMGLVYEAKGDYERALQAYEQAARLNPVYLDDALIRERMADCRRAASRAD
ncbi:MAG: tetratricopeptide repeat protein [bacterium]|nr:tetratricopeptide repeat protein [bacterium]